MLLVCYNVPFPSLELAPGTQCRLVKPMAWIRGSIQKGAIQAMMDVAQLLVAITIRWVSGWWTQLHQFRWTSIHLPTSERIGAHRSARVLMGEFLLQRSLWITKWCPSTIVSMARCLNQLSISVRQTLLSNKLRSPSCQATSPYSMSYSKFGIASAHVHHYGGSRFHAHLHPMSPVDAHWGGGTLRKSQQRTRGWPTSS